MGKSLHLVLSPLMEYDKCAVGRSGEVFEGNAALVTVPLGVLKAGRIQFQPPLPSWKQDAIQRLGFGDLNKVG